MKIKIERYGSLLLPVIAALCSPLTLYSENIAEIFIQDIFRSLLVSSVVALLLLGLFLIIFRDRKLAIITTVFVILIFFSYGHLYRAIKTWNVAGILIGRHRFLFPLICVAYLSWQIWVVRNRVARMVWYQLSMATCLISFVFPLLKISTQWGMRIEVMDEVNHIEAQEFLDDSEEYPDVYYIILDGYARGDILETFFDFDNSEFIGGLRERVFYVADEARSNYPITFLPLPSSLNMNYVNYLADEYTLQDDEYWHALMYLLRDSEVRDVLENEGYSVIAYESGHPFTAIYDADDFIGTQHNGMAFNSYEAMLLDTTIARFYIDMFANNSPVDHQSLYAEYETHRIRVGYILGTLGEIAGRAKRTFTFAHVISPHPPFLFDRNGRAKSPNRAFSFFDGSDYLGTTSDYVELYPDQLEYLNGLVLDAIDEILLNSAHTPYLIIQADHGPGAHLDWEDPSEEGLDERYGILNAYLFPDGDYQSLYPSISPVNSFRAVFNHAFNYAFPLLEEHYYYSYPGNLLLMEEIQFPDTTRR